MINVALLAPRFRPEAGGEDVRFVSQLAGGLCAAGAHTTVITSHPGLPGRGVEDGVEVLRLPRPPQGRLLRRRYVPYLTHVPLSYAALRAGHPDVAHATYLTDALAAVRWHRRTGRPAVLTYSLLADFATIREHRRHREVLLTALKGSSAVVAPSDFAADAFSWWLGYEARVIRPGVDLERLRPSLPRAETPTILVGDGTRDLGEAIAILRRRHQDLEVVHDSEPARAWVVALPDRRRASPLPALEALACGRPVVAPAAGAVAEVIEPGVTGALYDDPRAGLAEALMEALELAGNPQTQQRCRAAAEKMSAADSAGRYLQLYAELRG